MGAPAMVEKPRRRWLVTGVVLAVFAVFWELESLLGLAGGYRELFDTYGYWVPRSLRSVLEIALVLAAVCGLHRIGPGRGLAELGFRRPALRALGFGALAVVPMAVVFGLTSELAAELRLWEVLYLSLLSPLAEEAAYRGFLFGQLWRRAGWGMWTALLASAAVFGYGHAEDAGSLAEGAGLFLLTGAGAVVFGWLFARWGTLAAPVTVHVLMNLCWNLWNVGDSALAGWMPLALQLGVIVLAIVLTLKAAPQAGETASSRVLT